MGSGKKKVSFWAKEVVKVPVQIKFRTADGKKVSFSGTKAVSRDVKKTFYTKKK